MQMEDKQRTWPATTLLLLCLSAALPAVAAPVCTPHYPTPATLAAMFDMAKSTQQALDAVDGAQVVLLARGGQDLSRYGLKHSHLAFALREDDGTWRVKHLLNHCKSDSSELYREGLSNFIGESALNADLRVGVLAPALQQQLHTLLQDPAPLAHTLHEARYSMIAYPFSTEYQNSNQWVLEVLAAALAATDAPSATPAPVQDRRSAQAWLKRNGYQPTRLHLDLSKRIGARFFVANAAVTDHPASERISGNYSVITVESVFDFLQQHQLLQQDHSIPHSVTTHGAPP
ncbi:DUF2145 domain-containing protein [Xanthomonas sp. WHRI 8391]|uniref:Secreted protein n=2 Tax=Xanthomonas hortorum TaxID=56454 RepID=A0A6V7C485_9XANT|nr:DUF2145 domain-containing protein [Xanthomonas hortorum]ETC89646.1 hypothetical protein XHC_0814 [Xanthomonas hortorum pv. carotae str. M081]MBG3850041.1 DUF2145 domain-containing protein [Xanthomonas hortorum pv. carotae]UTS73760.1 DUF2145 domain-containing protein [Xanthomonas hortorum]CAD0309258.1 hypothetical protein CFBP7900_06860 [Xanthomonas hortorum pv. carotae]CAD0309267.1 hypothetical protein CFBP7900_06860 [Xanthomonas hortorum pv. carotae]